MISQGHTSRRHWIHCAFERVFGDPRQLASGGACATPLLHARPAPSVSRQAFSPCARIYFSTNTRRRSRGGTRLPSPCPPSPLPASSGTRHCRKCARVRACPSAWAHTLTERASSDAPSTPRTACNCHRCHWCATSREFPFWFSFFLFFRAVFGRIYSLFNALIKNESIRQSSTSWLSDKRFVALEMERESRGNTKQVSLFYSFGDCQVASDTMKNYFGLLTISILEQSTCARVDIVSLNEPWITTHCTFTRNA